MTGEDIVHTFNYDLLFTKSSWFLDVLGSVSSLFQSWRHYHEMQSHFSRILFLFLIPKPKTSQLSASDLRWATFRPLGGYESVEDFPPN